MALRHILDEKGKALAASEGDPELRAKHGKEINRFRDL